MESHIKGMYAGGLRRIIYIFTQPFHFFLNCSNLCLFYFILGFFNLITIDIWGQTIFLLYGPVLFIMRCFLLSLTQFQQHFPPPAYLLQLLLLKNVSRGAQSVMVENHCFNYLGHYSESLFENPSQCRQQVGHVDRRNRLILKIIKAP